MELLNFTDWNRNPKKGLVWGILLFLFLLLSSSLLGQDKVKFYAAGVTCSMCSKAIHNSLSSDNTITKINPNLNTQEWFLEFKTGEFKIETLKRRVESAGFSLDKVWLNDQLIFTNTKKKKDGNKEKRI